jgi:RNA polymerase sigma-32 factor
MISSVTTILQASIERAPRLSREEELALVAASRRGDDRAGARLVLSHLRFVLHIAKRYRQFGCPIAELLQEGTVGLIEAIRRFNPDRGVRLSTYAMWWIRAAIQDYVVRSRSLVRIGTTATQKSMFFALCRCMAGKGGARPFDADALREDAVQDDVVRAVAERFDSPLADVASLARRIARPDRSLDRAGLDRAGTDDEEGSWLDRLADVRPGPEERLARRQEFAQRVTAVVEALKRLPPRELLIIQRRYLVIKRQSRVRVGRELGLSKERVRQLELRALDRMRALLGRPGTGAGIGTAAEI